MNCQQIFEISNVFTLLNLDHWATTKKYYQTALPTQSPSLVSPSRRVVKACGFASAVCPHEMHSSTPAMALYVPLGQSSQPLLSAVACWPDWQDPVKEASVKITSYNTFTNLSKIHQCFKIKLKAYLRIQSDTEVLPVPFVIVPFGHFEQTAPSAW